MPPTELAPTNYKFSETSGVRHGRQLWIDAAKGIGILLVVLGHVLRGLNQASLIDDQVMFLTIDRAIYLFHMPLFFVISGYLFVTSYSKSSQKFLSNAAIHLLWPMALWTWIFFMFKILAGAAANSPTSINDFPWWPLPPREHLWFFWALFLTQSVTFVLVSIVPASRWLVAVFVAFVVACVVRLWLQMPVEFYKYLGSAIAFLPAFLLGGIIRLSKAESSLGHFLLPLILVFAVSEFFGWLWPNADFVNLFAGVFAACAVLFAVFRTVELTNGAYFHWLAQIGEASLAIFVAHTIVGAAVRIVLVKIGVTNLPLHIAFGVGLGVIVPFIMHKISLRLGLSRIVGL